MKFPIITDISQILDVVRGRDEFVVAEREGFTVIDYQVMMPDTFPPITDEISALRRECRGIKFGVDGKILARPFHKFFNLNERDEALETNIDWSQNFTILDKLDGSMIHPILLVGEYDQGVDPIIFCTRMGNTDIAQDAQEFCEYNTEIAYFPFCRYVIGLGYTPVFEWCSMSNIVVIAHRKPKLILTAMRHMETGEYLTPKKMWTLAAPYSIPIVESWKGDFEGISKFVSYVKDLVGEEGYVFRFDDGRMYKTKSDWYVRIHKAKDQIAFEKNIIKLILHNDIDDILPDLLESDRKAIERYREVLCDGIGTAAAMLDQVIKMARKFLTESDPAGRNKRFALEFACYYKGPIKSLLFKMWRDEDLNGLDAIIAFLLDPNKDRLRSRALVEEMRPLIGKARWEDYYAEVQE